MLQSFFRIGIVFNNPKDNLTATSSSSSSHTNRTFSHAYIYTHTVNFFSYTVNISSFNLCVCEMTKQNRARKKNNIEMSISLSCKGTLQARKSNSSHTTTMPLTLAVLRIFTFFAAASAAEKCANTFCVKKQQSAFNKQGSGATEIFPVHMQIENCHRMENCGKREDEN